MGCTHHRAGTLGRRQHARAGRAGTCIPGCLAAPKTEHSGMGGAMQSWQHSSAGVALLGAGRGMLGHVWGHRGAELAWGRGTGGVGSGWREQWLCTCPAPTHAPVGPATPGMWLAALPAQLRGRGCPGTFPAPPAAPGPAQLPPVRTQTPCSLLAPPPGPAPRPPSAGAHPVWGRLWGRAPLPHSVAPCMGIWGPSLQYCLPPCPAGEVGKATHVCCQHRPIPGAGAILAQPQLLASTFAKAGPWHLAPKPRPSLLAFLQEDAVSLPVHLCWGAAPTLCRGSLAPPIGTDTAGHSGAAGAAEGCPASGCSDCRAGGPQFGAVSVSRMKGQAGALGAVFQHLPVWGSTLPFPHTGAHTWCLSGKVIG